MLPSSFALEAAFSASPHRAKPTLEVFERDKAVRCSLLSRAKREPFREERQLLFFVFWGIVDFEAHKRRAAKTTGTVGKFFRNFSERRPFGHAPLFHLGDGVLFYFPYVLFYLYR